MSLCNQSYMLLYIVGLQDQSAYVRRVAVVSCTRIGLTLEELQEAGFIDQLYRYVPAVIATLHISLFS